MFNLEEYKEEVIARYHWKRDNTEEERAKRRSLLAKCYSDAYLESILDNTEKFIFYLLDRMYIENKIFENKIYTLVPLEDELATDTLNDLDLNLGGGYPSDTFIYLEKDKLISMSLLKKFFQEFHIECTCEEFEVFNEKEQAGHIEEKFFFYITGPLAKFNELIEQAQNLETDRLINDLNSRVRTNKIK